MKRHRSFKQPTILAGCEVIIADRGSCDSAGPAGALSLVTAIRLAGGRKTNQFDAVNSARAHADQLAAKLGRNRSAREISWALHSGDDEDGEEVYRAPLTNRV